jgi:predicted secreted protein
MDMPIGPITMVAIYFVCWWTVLFAVLPLGTSSERHEPPTDGAQWGAPDKPNLKRKFLTTSWVAAVLWLLVMALVWFGWMPLPDLAPPVPTQ